MVKKIDTQITGMAGEFLVIGKLFKRGYQASLTLGNAKSIDIFVYNNNIDKTYSVQVKTLRRKNCFLLKKESLKEDYVYIFVILNDFYVEEEFFILTGREILENLDKFYGSSYKKGKESKMPAINYGPLKEYKDRWSVFDV